MNKTTKQIIAVTVATLFLTPNLSMAFKLPSVGGNSGSSDSSNSGGGDPVAQQDQLVTAYVSADKDVLKAQSKMADAVGLKERAAKLSAAGDALGAGATKDSLQASETMQSEASQEIQARLKDSNLQLDAEGKKKFTEALGNLGRGVVKYSSLKGPINAFQSSVTGSGVSGALTAASKLGVGKFIVTSAPTNLRNLSSTLNSAVSFAKSHDIPVPADATAAL